MTSETQPVRVLLVEDEENAFAWCADIVAGHPDLMLSGGATSLSEAMSLLCAPLAFDLLLTDWSLGDGDAAPLLDRWNRLGGRAAMVITVLGDVDSVLRAVQAGADGYLLKSGSDYEVMNALTTVLAGGAPISAAVAGHLLQRIRNEPPIDDIASSLHGRLSNREIEILKELAKGFSYKEVARNKSISPHTVADYVKVIYRKLSVNSRSEAVYEAVRGGLIDLSEA